MSSVLSPLQLTSGATLLNGQGINPLPTALAAAIAAYNSTTLVTNIIQAIAWYKAQAFYTESTFDSLLSIGSTTCPALGNSIPAGALASLSALTNAYITGNTAVDDSTFDPSGLSNFIEQLGSAELGNGDVGKFCQGFLTVAGYTNVVNQFITSSVNAPNYLGPTFTSMDALTTADVATINPVFDKFGTDIARQGQLVNTKKLDLYGTPAGLIQQLSAVAGVQRQAIPSVQAALSSVGLSNKDIENLVTDNRISLFNPNGLTNNQFDKLQKQAYVGMNFVTDDALQEVLDILDVTTPGITSMADLLDPQKTFPLSYPTMRVPTPTGPQFIYGDNGSVNSSMSPIIDLYLPTSSGCDELGKIIPQASATANKAIQVGLQNITNIANTTWPELAQAINSFEPTKWDNTQEYLPNTVVSVSNGLAVPTTYRSQQEVPAGIDINNTSYWEPVKLGNLITMRDLPLIEAQTQAVDDSVTNFYENEVATGSGQYGTLLITDVIGTSIDAHDFATALNSVTNTINTLQGAGTLLALNTALTNLILSGNDAGVITQIAAANAAIVALATATKDALNALWVPIATALDFELQYQTQAGVNYFDLPPSQTLSIYSFVQGLPGFSQDQSPGQAWDYLTYAIDSNLLGGQAAIGAIREAYNVSRLEQVGIGARAATQVPLGSVPGGDFVDPAGTAELYNTYPKNRGEITTP
jgi:hypothetical protein